MNSSRPIVLCLSGLDPTGGAGIQADIEAMAAAGVHALPVVTALTVQDTRNVKRVEPVDLDLLSQQIDTVLADCRIEAVKIGLLGDAVQTRFLAATLATLTAPVICDPVLRAGGGLDLATEARIATLRDELLPRVTLLTPNAAEARRLTGSPDSDAAARRLLELGCKHVLVTGGDERGGDVVNSWHTVGAAPRRYHWPRLPETFHGAGCTLASAIAARLALGKPLEEAIEEGQRWTQQTLQTAIAIGHGRRVPNRPCR
jgi:hydroxymethylpyrimidine/phosphomethylpyrimidine kinase